MHFSVVQCVLKMAVAFEKENKEKQKAVKMHPLMNSTCKTYKFFVPQNFKLSYEVRQQMATSVIYENCRKTLSIRSPFYALSSYCQRELLGDSGCCIIRAQDISCLRISPLKSEYRCNKVQLSEKKFKVTKGQIRDTIKALYEQLQRTGDDNYDRAVNVDARMRQNDENVEVVQQVIQEGSLVFARRVASQAVT